MYIDIDETDRGLGSPKRPNSIYKYECIFVHFYEYQNTYIHTYIYTYVYTYIYIHIYMYE
jgi:hypothetical protein